MTSVMRPAGGRMSQPQVAVHTVPVDQLAQARQPREGRTLELVVCDLCVLETVDQLAHAGCGRPSGLESRHRLAQQLETHPVVTRVAPGVDDTPEAGVRQ